MEHLHKQLDALFPAYVPVVFLQAHPDDESFLCAGLVQALAPTRPCILVYCAAALVEGQSATRVRQEELARACTCMREPRVKILPFSEPKYAEKGGIPLQSVSISEISREVLKTLQEELQRPFILVSYDKNGGYGNEDHKIVHLVGRAIAASQQASVVSLVEVTLCREEVNAWIVDAQKRLPTESLPKLSFWSAEFGLPSEEMTHVYLLTEEQCVLKRKALSMHVSQMSSSEFPLSLSQEDFRAVFGKEFLSSVQLRTRSEQEIERKFLVSEPISWYLQYPAEEIIQGYFPKMLEGIEERIREKAGTYVSTLKYGTGPYRSSDERAIDQSRFQLLWPKTKGKRIHKIRYHIPYERSLVELDVFQGDRHGLMVAEVEFRSQEEANAFVPPDWFGEEVTQNPRYTNYELAL